MWSPSKELLPEELVSVRGREEAWQGGGIEGRAQAVTKIRKKFERSRLPPPFTNAMAWRSAIVLVVLCLGLTVRADEYGEADGDATGASDAIGAL